MNSQTEAPPLSITALTFQYRIRETPAIQDISFDLQAGELLLIAGASGCGKTTLMRCVNGLIPRTYRGTMGGGVTLFGQDALKMSMADLSQTVGTLLQDPEQQIVGSHVTNEIAFGLENLGMKRRDILRRIDETLDYLGILHLAERDTFGLSGGEKQLVALAGVLAMRPRILLLDEPLASLDPATAHDALQTFRRLADEGVSVMLVEHRVSDALAIGPDHVLYMDEGKQVYYGDPAGMMDVVDYNKVKLPAQVIMQRAKRDPVPVFIPAVQAPPEITPLVEFNDVHFTYDESLPEVLHNINLTVNAGDIIAILGPNAAGKTTLVKHALGLLKPTTGEVLLEQRNTNDISVAQAASTIGYVFQSPTQMLFAPTVEQELIFGPRNLKHNPADIEKNVSWAIDVVNMRDYLDSPPLALSFGQQKRVSIAAVLAMRSRILMMDEPTAGQDYWNYVAFMDSILQMEGFDAVIFITHDLDLAISYANRVVLVADGRIAGDGKPEDILRDYDLLKRCRVLPTSLLDLNIDMLPITGRFMRAELLAHHIDSNQKGGGIRYVSGNSVF